MQLLATAYGIVSQLAPAGGGRALLAPGDDGGRGGGLVAGWATAGFFWRHPGLKPFGMHEGILGLLVHVPS